MTIGELLSGEELLTIAEEDTLNKERRTRELVFALFDISVIMLLFLPLFGQTDAGVVQAVSLINLEGAKAYLIAAYYTVVIGSVVFGLLSLMFKSTSKGFGLKNKISLAISFIGVLLFVISQQPYATTLMLVLLTIKVVLLIKWR